jgi:hypothetical protein
MRRLLIPGLLALVVVLPAGCVKSDSKLVLHADGSVDVKHKAAVNEKAWRAFMVDLFKSADYKPEPLYNQKKIAAALKRIKDLGVTVKVFKVERKDGWQRLHLEARCRDLLAAGYLAKAADMEVKYVLVKNPDGSYTLREEDNRFFEPSALPPPEATAKQQQQARERVKGLHMVRAFVVPGDVKATTATERKGRTVKWALDGSDPDLWKKARALYGKPTSVRFAAAGLKLKEVGRHRYFLQHTDVALKSDGTVTVTEKKSAHLQMLEELQGLGRATGKPSMFEEFWFDEKRVRALAQASLPKGARLLEVKCDQQDGWKRAVVRRSYPDLDAARKGPLSRLATLRKLKDGNYEFALLSADRIAAHNLKGPSGKVLLGYRISYCSFMKASHAVTVPGKVISTNAHGRKGEVVNWSYAKGDPDLEDRVRKRITEGMTVVFKGDGVELKEFAKPAKAPPGAFGYRERGGRRRRTVIEVVIDKTKYSKIYPAVWFSPSSGEITSIKVKSEEPPEKKYEIWIEPNDPEFAFLKGAKDKMGFALIGYGEDVFNKPEIPEAPELNKRLDKLVEANEIKKKPVFFCRAKSSTCLIMVTVMDEKTDRLVFRWKRLKKK